MASCRLEIFILGRLLGRSKTERVVPITNRAVYFVLLRAERGSGLSAALAFLQAHLPCSRLLSSITFFSSYSCWVRWERS